MATSAATSAQGTLLKVGDAASPTEAFTTIAEVKDIDGPGMEAESLDATNHSSPEGWKEKVAGLLNGGEVTFEMNALPANATQDFTTGIMKDFIDRTLRNFQIVFPDAGNETWTFAAIIKNVSRKMPVDGLFMADVTLDISGKPTFS